jgi:F-type H+-transporting ATPase subunit b
MSVGNVLSLNATLVVELIVFVAVLGVVSRLVAAPLQRAMRQRRAEIETGIDQARRAEEVLARAEVDYEARLHQARSEYRQITDEAHGVAAYLREEGRRQGQAEYDRLVAQARRDARPPQPVA